MTENGNEWWNKVLKKISNEISKPSFETWFANTEAEIEGNTVIVKASNAFAADWIENRYKDVIFKTVKELMGEGYEVHVDNSDKADMRSEPSSSLSEYEELKRLTRETVDQVSELIEINKLQNEKIEALEKRISQLEAEK
ncbi:DnaA N-terminal domain-containing protein [Texcoconibacillus texcoconensis]|uniref:Chromosomal replication initiation ATPase DnaA n=1 Tax=Texcoconibacillus texcoconensis TaxID=1095777 RepID=A0A840QPT9_9BACI|nr:DnaA N-terminal domain-containing protein [Texcoconibacillus texcoconensis]MBB5173358.1 chromosomal replication initiation ATPase DnaA [Texcoconibacillus texcoconensis]